MSRAIATIAKLFVAPIAVPVLRARRARLRERVEAVGYKHGLAPTRDARVSQRDRRLVGRVDGHVVIVGREARPRINVLLHWHRRLSIGFGEPTGHPPGTKPFDTEIRGFDRRFRTRFVDRALVAEAGEERFRALMGEFATFASRWHRRLDDLFLESKEIKATLRHFPFVPTIDPHVLDEMLPGVMALANRVDATLGHGGARVVEGEFLGTEELLQVGPSPVSTAKAPDELAKPV